MDDDCDGTTDGADASDASTWNADADGDGYGDASSTVVACDQPSGMVTDNTDCDDSNAARYPGATEVCEDGVVNDCDADHSNSARLCRGGNEIDETAWLELTGEDDRDNLGTALAGAGDLDSDGYDDVLIGTEGYDDGGSNVGAAFVVAGPLSGSVGMESAWTAAIVGSDPSDYLGSALASGDWDSDGVPDLWIGADGDDLGGTNSGAVFLLLGPVSGTVSAELAAYASFVGASGDRAGGAIANAGDVDGDGVDDMVVGATEVGDSNTGGAWVVLGGSSGSWDLANAWPLTGEAANDSAGHAVSGAGDTNGDGYEDLLVGAFENDGDGSKVDRGAAYLVLGSSSQPITELASAEAVFLGYKIGDCAGYAVSAAGDVDEDGLGDVAIGAPCLDYNVGTYGYGDEGAVYVYPGGSISGSVSMSTGSGYLLRVRGDGYKGEFGASLAPAGDVDGDGRPDLLAGSTAFDNAINSGVEEMGAFYLLLAAELTGGFSSDVGVKFRGVTDNSEAGYAVSGAGDFNGTGADEVIVSAPKQDGGGTNRGVVTVIDVGL